MRNILVKYFKGDSVIWGIMVLLAIISMMVVYSSTGTLAYRYQGGNTSYYMLKQGVFLLLGFGVAYLLHRIHYKFYSKLSVLMMPVAVVLLVLTLFSGSELNDASRWLRVPFIGLSFQPSEFAKYILVMYVARHLSRHQSELNPPREAFWPVVLGLGAVCVPIISEDFSTAFLITFICFSMMLVGRIPILYLGGSVLAAAILVAFLVLLAPYFRVISCFIALILGFRVWILIWMKVELIVTSRIRLRSRKLLWLRVVYWGEGLAIAASAIFFRIRIPILFTL